MRLLEKFSNVKEDIKLHLEIYETLFFSSPKFLDRIDVPISRKGSFNTFLNTLTTFLSQRLKKNKPIQFILNKGPDKTSTYKAMIANDADFSMLRDNDCVEVFL